VIPSTSLLPVGRTDNTTSLNLPFLQSWVREQFGDLIGAHTAIEGVARLLEQCGQFAESIITRGSRDIRKELTDVLLVLLCLAEKEGIDLERTMRHDLLGRRAGDYMVERK